MAVAAGVVGDANVRTSLASFDMAAQSRRTERSIADMTFSWPKLTCPALASRQASPRWRKISASSTAGRDKRAAVSRASHLQKVERAGDLADRVDRDTGVERRGVELLVTEQNLNDADIGLLFNRWVAKLWRKVERRRAC